MNYQDINVLCTKVTQNIDNFLDHFGIDDLQHRREKLVGCCPVHAGDNKTALNFWIEGDEVVGNWKCHTHQCEKTFVNSAVGFIRGLLSRFEMNWQETYQKDRIYPFGKTIKFCSQKLGLSEVDYKNHVDTTQIEKYRFTRQFKKQYKKQNGIYIPREQYINSVNIPSKYYINTFPAPLLQRYDIGICSNPNKPMYQRSVFPIYNDDRTHVVGCSGRSVWEDKCGKCNNYHNPIHACNYIPSPKWKHNTGFDADNFFFNQWFAKDLIKEKQEVFITESPGNCLRLVEAGFENTLACLGTNFSDFHKRTLNEWGVLRIVYIKDAGSAGEEAAKKIQAKMGGLCNIKIPELNLKDDIVELSAQELSQQLK